LDKNICPMLDSRVSIEAFFLSLRELFRGDLRFQAVTTDP
jgi:hypothetical protein